MEANTQTKVLAVSPSAPEASVLEEAARVIRDGGLVVLPTETVYGIAADAMNPVAVARLRAAKRRPDVKPLPLMVSGPEGLEALAVGIPEVARSLAYRFWPGPLTLVLQAGEAVSDGIRAGTNTVGLRAPRSVVAQAVLAHCGTVLALTSANMAGKPAAVSAGAALAVLDGRVDLILDAGPCDIGHASTVLDMTVEPPVMLRQGALSAAELGLED